MKSKYWQYQHGLGIGGWLTNYKRSNVMADEWKMQLSPCDFEHFENDKDIKYVASVSTGSSWRKRLSFTANDSLEIFSPRLSAYIAGRVRPKRK